MKKTLKPKTKVTATKKVAAPVKDIKTTPAATPKTEKKTVAKVTPKKVVEKKEVKTTVTSAAPKKAVAVKVEKKTVVKAASKKVVAKAPVKEISKKTTAKVGKETGTTIKSSTKRTDRTGNIETVRIHFHLSSDVAQGAKEVRLMGDFNSWDPTKAVKMQIQKDGSFLSILILEKGRRYEYRFLLDGKNWITDENAVETVPTPFGVQNSVVLA